MSKKYLSFYVLFLMFHIYINTESAHSSCIKKEFDVREFWYNGIDWKTFNEIKKYLEREELIQYEDKIETQKLAQKLNIPVPRTFVMSREKIPLVELLATLPSSYVAKATHLTEGDGLIIVKDGVNIITGEPISPEQVEKAMHEILHKKPQSFECWSVKQVPPGFMIQEYIPNRQEIKLQTIFGKVISGSWRAGEKTTPILGRFDRNGNKQDNGNGKTPESWAQAVAIAELLAQGTDALRVDLFVGENGEILFNELEIYPATYWSKKIKVALEAAINDGYRDLILNCPKEE